MDFRSYILFIALFLYCYNVTAQKNKQVVIIADVSDYKGKLLASEFKEWMGNDSLVPAIIDYHAPSYEHMGAEYLVFSNEGNAINPKSDSTLDVRLKIWRKKANVDGNIYKWVFNCNEPRLITNEALLGGTYLVLPGDSIHVRYNNDKYVFSGDGSVKFQLYREINAIKKSVTFPIKIKSLYEIDMPMFFKLNNYLNQQVNSSVNVLESSKNRVNEYEYNWLKANVLAGIEYNRYLYFTSAQHSTNKNLETVYSTNDLGVVWDTTMYKPEARWFRSGDIQNLPGIGSMGYSESFHGLEVRRQFNFLDHDSITNRSIYKKLIYEKLKANYTGLYRERLLCYFLQEEVIQEGFAPYNWFMKSIANDYYSISEFPAYKRWMKEYEKSKETRYAGVSSVGMAPLFQLKNEKGNTFNNKDVLGKFTVVYFWYSGCDPCKQTASELTKLQALYKDDPNIIFLNVSVDIDKNKWGKAVTDGVCVPKGGVQLYTGGLGKDHEMIKDFNIKNFPTIRMFNHNGSIVIDEKNPFATILAENEIAALIGRQLVKLSDGPYVFFEDGRTNAYTIKSEKIKQLKSTTRLTSATDQYSKSLNFSLQKKITIPSSSYPAASKLLVLSDIEGNFSAFRRLLQSSKIIDEGFNWIFDDGHLVFAGDMFDRGEQVTECLWLIYSLEEKAKAAGGAVHFVLGNHEIMNLQGNHKYVVEKYKKNARLLNKTLMQLYKEDSELGRWLRTKNIMEKIGDLLFVHGGVSSDLNNSPVTIPEINEVARPHYADTTRTYGDANLNIMMSSKVGPFWYRGYYDGKLRESMVDSTLQKFDVKHIITGHTIVADTISMHYKGKVFNTDVKHASGKSEALLIEGSNFYRVNTEGKKVLLFTDDKRKTSGK